MNSDAVDDEQLWRRAGLRVRLCMDADEPRLIDQYLTLGVQLHRSGQRSEWDVAKRSAHLLLQTAADRALPMHWRGVCLDQIHRPLTVLAGLAVGRTCQRELFELRAQLAMLNMDPAASVPPTDDSSR